MALVESPQCNILLLTADQQLFQGISKNLRAHHFTVLDSWEDESIHAVIMDSFFLFSGAGPHFYKTNHDVPLLCAIEEKTKNRSEVRDGLKYVDELILLPEKWRQRKTEEALQTIVENSQYLKFIKRSEYDFGKGLWASFIQYFQNVATGTMQNAAI